MKIINNNQHTAIYYKKQMVKGIVKVIVKVKQKKLYVTHIT